jgi:hypothetical protein
MRNFTTHSAQFNMIIANPIYDSVFKRLMENEKVAKFFIGTLLEQTIEAVEVKPQEYTYEGEFNLDDSKDLAALKERMRERLSILVYRLDFIATIKTANGDYKKVLIEIQKAKNPIDLMRFRNYLAEQYKREDKINGRKDILPITTIYILGFDLPEITSPCIKVERNYLDLVNQTVLLAKSDFVEKLTHDSYVVQVGRITDRYQTRLDKLLSLFEQAHFVDEKQIVKQFNHAIDEDGVKLMADILHYTGTDPEEKRRIETEQEAIRTINVMLEGYVRQLAETTRALNETEKALSESKKIVDEKDKLIAELMRKIGGQ